jgi:hypothetical protein
VRISSFGVRLTIARGLRVAKITNISQSSGAASAAISSAFTKDPMNRAAVRRVGIVIETPPSGVRAIWRALASRGF